MYINMYQEITDPNTGVIKFSSMDPSSREKGNKNYHNFIRTSLFIKRKSLKYLSYLPYFL